MRFPETHEDPARELCGYSDGLEVTSPASVRDLLAEIGSRLVAAYACGGLRAASKTAATSAP